MAKLDQRRLAGFLADPDAACRVVLVHGDDAGLVHERAREIVAAACGRDPLRLLEPGREAARDTASLANAAASVPLFGAGRVAVRVREASDSLLAAAQQALAGSGPGLVVLEAAGDGRSTQKLRRALEAAPAPAAQVIACYRESDSDRAASIRRLLRALGIAAHPAALAWMVDQLAEDHLLMRREIEKLALYAQPGEEVALEDAVSVIAVNAALEIDQAVSAALAGAADVADRALESALADGASAVQIIRTALRQVQRLAVAAQAVAGGMAPGLALDGLRPPVFFREKPQWLRALQMWRPGALEAAAAALLDAERRTKTTGLPDAAVARSAIWVLTRGPGSAAPPTSW